MPDPKIDRRHLDNAAKHLERAVKTAAIECVKHSLEYDAPERTWERKREIARRAVRLQKITDIDPDLIADALLRSLLPGCY